MTAEELVLALDQGGHASRAFAFDASGAIVASASVPVETRRIGADRVEHDADEIAGSLRAAVDQAAAALGSRAGAIGAAGLAVQRSTVACWDRVTGASLAPAISWQDRRAAAWLAQVDLAELDDAEGGDATDLRAITGLVASPHYGAGKLRWWLDHDGAVRAALRGGRLAWGPLASFLLARLLEERPHVVDPACASRTMLWDRRTRDWSAPLLERFGLPAAPLPRCVPSRFEFGHLAVAGRRVPLRVVTGDQSAAVFASGAPEAGAVRVNAGTGAFVLWLLGDAAGRRVVDAPRLLRTVLWQERAGAAPPGGRTPPSPAMIEALEGTVNGAASAIESQARALGLDARDAVARLDGWLAAEARPPIFLNGVGGLGSPFWRPDFESRYVGAEAASAPARIAAVAESAVFLIAENVRELRGSGAAPERLVLSGGLARVDGIARRLAAITDLPVERRDVHEATAAGLARLVRRDGASAPASGAADARRIDPAPDPALRERYERWRRAMLESA